MMRKLSYIAFFGVILVLILGFWLRTMVTKVGVDQVGVRTQNFGVFGEKGVFAQDYDKPGYYRNYWLIDSWTFYDKTVQTLHLHKGGTGTKLAQRSIIRDRHLRGQQSAMEDEDIRVKSKDGYDVSLDITVKFRIKPGQAHKLLQQLGPGDQYKVKVENETKDACRIVFGGMRTEEFYNPEIRATKTIEAAKLLQDKLDERFVEIVGLLVRDVRFDEQYERKIKEKKLADQDIELNRSREQAAEFKGRTNEIKAKTEAMIRVMMQSKEKTLAELKANNDLEIAKITADYQAYATERRAEADLYGKRKEAEGTKAVKQAEAEGARLKSQAMGGPGGKTMVALEAAQNVELKELTVSTLKTEFLDLEAMADLFGTPRAAAGAGASKPLFVLEEEAEDSPKISADRIIRALRVKKGNVDLRQKLGAEVEALKTEYDRIKSEKQQIDQFLALRSEGDLRVSLTDTKRRAQNATDPSLKKVLEANASLLQDQLDQVLKVRVLSETKDADLARIPLRLAAIEAQVLALGEGKEVVEER